MRSIPEDRTTRALIRDEALALFAAHGPDSVTVRRIATAAGVSPGLVVHHFGSKDGLRQEVDQYVVAVFEAMLGELTGGDGGAEALDSGAGAASLSAAFTRHLPDGSPLPGYLRRLLLSDTDAGRLLFGRLYEVSRAALDGLTAAGLAVPGRDPAVRAALLLANDLAVFLLRDRIGEALGTDPLSADGMARWAPEVLDIYAGGLNASPPPESTPDGT
ncbi:TetR/AcrR family transcriptional regulator [Streptomyces sp. NPDC001599]|uniref:TetR/AcrR family transcriptional regulator n=1 Tax=Streptomyces sp. NPDC001599 TaxID=3364591 RepID=UPI0036AD2CB2